MAANFLEENLRSLHESLSADASKKEHATSLIDDLNQICIQEITEKDIDFTCSCLFDKEYGLVRFLNKAVTNEELSQCKTRALEFLAEFLEKVEKKILPYAVDIKDMCVSLFFRERLAKVKCAAMPVLSKLLELTVGSSLGEQLQIDKLINRFFTELSTSKTPKPSATVKRNIYIVLGIIAEVYPEYMTPYAERLTGLFLAALKAEMNSKTRKPELSIIEGCLEGLSCSLVNFTESAEEGSKNSYEIFKYARNAIDPKIELTRYAMPQAGLKLFARHASQFSLYLIEDYENMYSKLCSWSHHKNTAMLQLGMRAMESFLSQVSEMLKEKAKGGKDEGGGVFKFFVRQFREIMNNDKATSKELSLAIKGYGLLAAPCKCYLGDADVQFMFVEMLTKTEQQFVGESDDLENKLYNLPSFLESLASIIREMGVMSEAYTISLEHLMVLLVDNLPTIPKKTHFLSIRSLLLVLLALMPKGTTFKQVLSGFVYQSLIRTCSYMPVIEVENEGEITADKPLEQKITYKNFLDMWSGLLDAPRIKEFGALDITLETRIQLTDAIYNEIITAVLKILDKLDLTSNTGDKEQQEGVSTTRDDDEVTSADPLLGVQASKPQDFQIFINLVDFYQELLPEKNYEKFECWVFPVSHKLILMSTDNPLASGFYKLLSVCMKIANKLHFFQQPEVNKDDTESKSVAMETDSGELVNQPQKHTCYLLVKKFSKEVLVRMKQYRDELLAACLTFILALPKEVIVDQMTNVVPAIQVTLKLGLSYLPLAMVAMDALEAWSRSLPGHVMKKHYSDILPCLDSFLKTSEQGADNVDVSVTTNKSSSGKGRKKIPIRLVKGPQKDRINQSYQSQLAVMKQRIMRYLGQLGGSVNAALLANTDTDIADRAIAWDTEQHLKFDMPFVDMKPTIYLDPFLPHVTELAMTSSDRQTKVAACELLHSLVLYSIGRGAQQPGARVVRASMDQLFKNIFPVMLKLACDVEPVAKELFEPLTMQIIHWFTGSKKSESAETITLLDAIYNGMIQQSDTALRDFCARCLHEFLKWAIKQTNVKKAETNPANAKSVLKRLFSYARHPCPFKRLGAALAFNNIYTVFREEEPLVNLFTFELLVHFVESLAIAHGDEKSLGTQEQCCKALEHLEKIIRHKAALLKVKHKDRTQPKNWSTVTLEICVRWLTRQCGRPETECRHACMKLSYQLCTLLGGIKTPVKFFQACLKGKGPDYWIQRFEGGGHAGSVKFGIEGAAHLTDQSDVFTLQTTLAWFDNVLAALDCYTWVFGENLLSPGELFAKRPSDSSKSKIFVSLEYFITQIALVDIAGVGKLFPHKIENDFFTPKEMDDFNRAKCTVVIRLFGFLTIMLAKYKKETLAVTPASIWGPSLWEVLCCCVVKPADVGFNLGDVEIMKNLPQEMNQTLAVFNMSFRKEMVKHFSKSLKGDRDLLSQLPIGFQDASTNHIHIQQVLSGYQQLHEVDILLPCLPGQKGTNCALELLENVFKGLVCVTFGEVTSVTFIPTAHGVAKTMLKLALSLGVNANTLMEKIFDPTKVNRGSMKDSEQTHGDLFFTMFKNTICQYFCTNIDDLVPTLVKKVESHSSRVCAILTATVDTVAKNRELRKKDGVKVLTAVLSQWSSLAVWWGPSSSTDTQGMTLILLTKLLLIDSKFISSPDHKSFSHVFSMYQTMLTDKRTKISFKCRVLDLLPFLAGVPEPHTAELKGSLDRFVADNFPLRSSELVKGSPQYQNYIAALDKILAGFQLSGSLMLLEYLISIFCREPIHVHEDAIQSAITKFTKRLGHDRQKLALDVPFNIFVKTGSFPSEIRRAVIERVCLTMLRLVNKSVVIDFFSGHIVQIKEMIEARLTKSSEAVLEGQLISRMGCFQLLETMYSRLTKEEVVGLTSPINKVFCGGNPQTGKELTSFVSKQALEAKSEDMRGETILLELRRQYHCVAYNLMIAFISRTQTELKFYTVFLFEEKENKGQFLLDNFIDKERSYEFQAELMSPMERKKKFVSIHQEVKERRHGDDDDSFEDTAPSFHLASQYLADSSLSDDVSQYFSMSGTVGSVSSNSSRGKRPSSASPETDQDVEVTVEGDYVELEMDDINKHECMATMIAVIKHMQQAKITPEVTPGTSCPPMPSWMEKLHTKMTNTRTQFNIKLYIAKLIINTAKVFEPYGSHWLQPLTQLIISGPLGSGSINYFIVDLVVTMLLWHKTAIPKDTPEDKALSSRLVHFIVKNIYHDNRQVFRNNLEMLKTLLECWKTSVEIPYQEVYQQFSNADLKSKENLVGIQVLGVVIACKFSPYGPVAPVDRDRYYSKFANNMGNNGKTIYAPAAEVCGLIFQYLADKEGETEGPFHTHVANLLMNLHKGRPDAFIVCVHRMQKHFPTIADRFVNKLLFMLPQLHGEFRTLCLEILHSRIDSIENVYLELKSKGIMASLAHRDEATQQISLKIIKSILPKLKCKELTVFMPLISAFGLNPSTGCRNVMYEILMWVYDNYRDEDTEEAHLIIQQTKECLLKGLADDDLHCRLQVQNFWSSETRLPVGTLDRLVAMLEAMYSPVTEQQYLSYATNLILEMTSKSPDYQREIFEHPLSECKFSDYSVKSSWRHRHAAMTPLFATQASQSQMEVEDSVDGVRATQDAQQFTQTQEAGAHKGPFNWLTQSSLDTYADASVPFTMETQSTSSTLLFTIGTGATQGSGSRRPKPGAGFGKHKLTTPKPSTSAAKKEAPEEGNELYRLKRRFLKDREQSHVYFAKRHTKMKDMREVARQEQKAKRESQVTMYRKYRSGDLPDIQIKYSYIIAPLQALAHNSNDKSRLSLPTQVNPWSRERDSTVAKLLLSAIFQAIFANRDEVKTEREITDVTDQINKSLDNVLSASTQYYPPFIGCVLDILYNLRSHLKVENVSNVGGSAVFSKLQPLGIVVLEEQLILHEPTEPRAAKRGRMDTPISQDANNWIELARLYKSVEEYDVLLGIFSGKIGTKPITQKAVEAEARGDYSTARKLYEEAMGCTDWSDGNPLDVEIDLWEGCQMECLSRLCQWDTLEMLSVDPLVDGESPPVMAKIWEDTFLQEHFLPFIMKSKVKLLLHGDENQQPLLEFIDNSMKLPEHKLALESSYSSELALLYLWQEDYDRARHYCNTALDSFLQEWSSTDTLMTSSRAATLQKLQPLTELQEFLRFISVENNFRSPGPATSLVNSWNKRTPHYLTDPVTIWDDVVTNRSVYLDHISAKLQKLDDSQNSMEIEADDMFLNTKLTLKLKMAESCREQNNYALTLKILKETYSECKRCENDRVICTWTHLYAGTHQKKVQTSLEPVSEDSINSLFTTLDQLGKIERNEALTATPSLGRNQYVLGGHGRELLALGIQDIDLGKLEGTKAGQKLLDYTSVHKLSKLELTEQLVTDGYKKMKASLSVDDIPGQEDTFRQDQAYLATAKYCDTFLRLKQDEELEIGASCLKTFPETIIICLLRAMKLDCMEARQRFPRLLEMVEQYPHVMSTFVAKSKEVPIWMFMLWTSQMLAILDRKEALAVHGILEDIARNYPQAMVYAMKLSQEGYKFGNAKHDKVNKDTVDKLKSLLTTDKVPMADRFISALECLWQPDLDVKDSFEEMLKYLKNKKRAEVKEKYQEFYTRIFDYKNREAQEMKAARSQKGGSVSDSGDAMETEDDQSLISSQAMLDIGSYTRKFADKFKAEFDKRFGAGGKKLDTMSYRDLQINKIELNNLFDMEIKGGPKVKASLVPPEKLSEYSRWMSDFNPNTHTRHLEIPGQYTGLSKPMPEYHVKVSGFDQGVKVMSSIRKPKRITIRGNDEKDYHFLVKGGEDLRQDQRIEQLFYIMNQVFRKDPACRHRNLQLKTYQVIPMTARVGLIEWVADTVPLKEFINLSLTDQERKAFYSDHGPGVVYGQWIKKPSKANEKNWGVIFANVYKKYSLTETTRQLKITESKVPWDLLRRSFQKMSTSPEAFHVLRSHCMKTHAMLSIAQYIIGIGDRHLSNFMVNLKTGEMVGIDFGHAFGSASQFIPVPELMPFRLTRQLRNLMLPLQVKGLIESTMIHVLRALRSDSDLLLNTMDIFVKEPSLDWMQNAERQVQSMADEDVELFSQQEALMDWYPREKIKYVKRKLKGDNPARITRDELYLGHGKKAAFKDFETVVLGNDKDNVRAQLPALGLSVEQQVAALIDQATDPNILGRTWSGWEPWV